MRIFLDASIWLSAPRKPEGGSGLLLELAAAGKLVALSSVATLEEIRRNVEKVGRSMPELETLLMRVQPVLVPISKADLDRWATISEKDRHVIAGAVLGRADFLATLDKVHLDNPETQAKVPIAIGDAGACLKALRAWQK
ncbi:MAG: hypothetical protein OZSIB_2532 [Candidatus Ozemobacter sibiricus]|uniref:PIN domain-containing protein n=1 Tax=Candidatus Ozemobacter sibiricus TaxID=2268124 RepID=A0A367ZSN2_9BACT|nr:MAG: hypothetical protein OZSIB_2532 [Candidatus Ozemobacter sibiricus]